MAVGTKRYTVEEFEQLAALPENASRRLEYIGGDVLDVVSNNYSSLTAARILIRMGAYVESHDSGYVTGADGGYEVAGDRYIPDAAFVAKARQPEPSHEAYNPLAPDLAVEVLSPTDDLNAMRFKIAVYLAAGTTVWVADPIRKLIEVYAPGQTPRRFGVDDMVDGGEVLPGFSMAVRDVFPG